MEWLSNPLVHGLVGGVGVPLVAWLITYFLPRAKTRAFGVKIGKSVSFFGRNKLGAGWEKIEAKAQETITDLYEGFIEGLDADDQAKPE